MTQTEKANKELKSLLSQFKDSYRMACESSRNEYIKTLSPGAPLPKEGIIYGQEKKQEFESMCVGYRDKAREIIAKHLVELKEKATAPPSSDAVNSISMLSMRKNVTSDEINDLLSRYGDNPMCWDTIVSIAKENDIHSFGKHPVKSQIEDLEGLSKTIDKTLSVQSANAGHASDAFVSMMALEVDRSFPVQEG